METGYSLTLAHPAHLSALPEIEQQAATLFHGWNVPVSVIEETTSLEEFHAAQTAGLLWVALSPQHHPIGFALLEQHGHWLHLEELDVHPQHGRRGIGTALVEAVCVWGQAHGYAGVTLTTYRDIPWNGPFYARLGFSILDTTELTPVLQERVAEEAARGLHTAPRVVMSKIFGTY